MKTMLSWTVAALAVAAIGAPSLASAADINVVGARDAGAATALAAPTTSSMRGAGADATAGAVDAKVKIATADLLNRPTALINKNTLAMDNNVFVSRSNIVFSQSDRLALAKKVEDLVTSVAPASDMSTAVLTKSVLRAVSGSDSDAALMAKASAVVAAKGDASVRGQRIADLVRAALDTKQSEAQTQEQAMQLDAPRGVIVMVGTKDILRQPTAVVNKNVVVSDSQVAVSRSHVAPSQNDNVVLAGNAKVADAVLPASAIAVQTGADKGKAADATADTMEDALDNYRVGFLYSKSEAVANAAAGGGAAAATDKEQFWGLGGGLGFGWRYPLGYWNTFGAGLYGGGCGLGLAYGPFFYC